MARLHYLPYEEVRLVPDRARGSYHLQMPWLQLEFRSASIAGAEMEKIAEALASRNATDGAIYPAVDRLMSSLSRYPLWYVLPRTGLPPAAPLAPAPELATPLALVRYLRGISAAEESGNEIDGWDWESASAMGFAETADTQDRFDPLSLFTVIRRYYLLHLSHNDANTALYTRLRETENTDKFRHACALTLRQNHYVTSRCVEALSPAIPRAGPTAHLADYIKAETGHDRFLDKSLTALGFSANDLPVVDEAFLLMELLKYAATTNYLAFASLVDLFERGSEAEENPVATLMLQRGLSQAAAPLRAHREINHEGDHSNMAIELLREHGAVTATEALAAIRICELGAFLTARLSAAILERLDGVADH